MNIMNGYEWHSMEEGKSDDVRWLANQLIGLREKLQEIPIFQGKIYVWFPVDFPLSQPIELRQILTIDLNDLSRAEIYCRLLMARPCGSEFSGCAGGLSRKENIMMAGRSVRSNPLVCFGMFWEAFKIISKSNCLMFFLGQL